MILCSIHTTIFRVEAVTGPAERSLPRRLVGPRDPRDRRCSRCCSRRPTGRRCVQYCSEFDILTDDEPVRSATFGRANCRRLGAFWAVAQGLFALVAPRWSVEVTKRLLETNYENADELEPKPAYLRQVRALGIGLTAAGIVGFAMEVVADRETADDDAAE
jgi:hypothetical protein